MAATLQRGVLRSMPALLVLVLTLVAAPQRDAGVAEPDVDRPGAVAVAAPDTTASGTADAAAHQPLVALARHAAGPRRTTSQRILTAQYVARRTASRAPPSTVA